MQELVFPVANWMLLIPKLQAEVWHVQEEERERAAAAPIDLAADRQAALEVSGDEAYARRARSDLTSSRILRTGTMSLVHVVAPSD